MRVKPTGHFSVSTGIEALEIPHPSIVPWYEDPLRPDILARGVWWALDRPLWTEEVDVMAKLVKWSPDE